MKNTVFNWGLCGNATANSVILTDTITAPLENIWNRNVIEKTETGETGLNEMAQKISKDIIDQLKVNYDFPIKPQIEKYHIKHR